jgi:hypothetical protein
MLHLNTMLHQDLSEVYEYQKFWRPITKSAIRAFDEAILNGACLVEAWLAYGNASQTHFALIAAVHPQSVPNRPLDIK